jgi:hypothetical protein
MEAGEWAALTPSAPLQVAAEGVSDADRVWLRNCCPAAFADTPERPLAGIISSPGREERDPYSRADYAPGHADSANRLGDHRRIDVSLRCEPPC